MMVSQWMASKMLI